MIGESEKAHASVREKSDEIWPQNQPASQGATLTVHTPKAGRRTLLQIACFCPQHSWDIVAAMNAWLSVRTTIALFLVIFGIGLIFTPSPDGRLMVGAFLAAIGLTFLFWVGLALRER